MEKVEITKLRRLNARIALDLRLLSSEEFAQVLFECAVDGHNGIYCAQIFAERFCKGFECDLSQDTIAILLSGPDNELYFDAIPNLDLWYLESEGNEYKLHIGESGDYFVYDNALLLLWEHLTGKGFWEEYQM